MLCALQLQIRVGAYGRGQVSSHADVRSMILLKQTSTLSTTLQAVAELLRANN